jgi:hypothetical protein
MLARLAITLIWACAALEALGQSVVVDDFEGPEPSLREAGGDANYKIELHRRVAQGAHAGRACEQVRIAGNNGTYVYLSRSIGPARIIHELSAGIWLKADRPGLQILARVVLPRTNDPQTGKPLTSLVRGSDYQQAGIWQRLRLENVPRLLERQVRVLRTQFGSQVDPREAYVDLILLNVYGGPGVTNVWVDDLEIAGLVAPEPAGSVTEPIAVTGGLRPLPAVRPPVWPGGQGVPGVELKGRILLVGGKPFFPRSVEYRGEPLSRLQALGFNAAWLLQEPTMALLHEAAALGFWLVAPPPSPRELERRAGDTPGAKIGEAFDPVLAWNLGSGLAKRELEATKRWAELVKAADPRHRPLVCDADSDLYGYTRLADVLVARREPVGSTLPLDQYATWLRNRSRLARGGTPLWATIQTEPAARLLEQMELMAAGPVLPGGLDEPQLRMLIHAALSARARGLCFTSNSRLDADDIVTRRRAAILELVNLHLDLIERWPVTGNFAPTASSNDPHVTGAVIETDRSRLLLPIYAPAGSQFVMGNPTVKDLSFLVAGVPEESNAYELSPTAFRPLDSKRITGGTFVTLTESERDSVVVFTQDARVIRNISDHLEKSRARAAQLTQDIVNAQLVEVDAALQHLAAVGQAIDGTQKLRATAQTDLQECETLRKSDASGAYYRARHAQQMLREIQRAHWDRAAGTSQWPLADPFVGSFTSLSEHYRFVHELATAPRGGDRLRDGGFEDLQAMRQAGWKYYQHEQANIVTAVDLAPQAAHSGRLGLRLQATPHDPENKPGVVETPPLWITSPSINVDAREVLQIQGWLRVVAPIAGSVDGLLVIDTLSGEPLAERVTSAGEWRQFTVYRAAGQAGPMTVTFALSGLGEAWIDDVTVRGVARASVQPQQAQRSQAPTAQPRLGP